MTSSGVGVTAHAEKWELEDELEQEHEEGVAEQEDPEVAWGILYHRVQ